MANEPLCPYTGKTVRVQSTHMTGGPVVWFQTGAWSPNRKFLTERDARIQMLRRGPTWIEDTGQVMRCPYLGTEVSFVEVSGGVRPAGMYDPDRTYDKAEDLYRALGMRDGKPAVGTEEAPAPVVTVTHAEDEVPFEIRQLERQKGEAKAATIRAVAPAVAEVVKRRKQ